MPITKQIGLWVQDTSKVLGHLHELQQLGIDYLIVRIVVHDPVPVAVPYQPDAFAQLITDAASIGMGIVPWAYGYPGGQAQQISTIAHLLMDDKGNARFTDIVWDMEVEWESVDAETAEAFFHDFAVATGHQVTLHLSSFVNTAQHPIPYAAFLKHCRGGSFMPQCYREGDPLTPVPLVASRLIGQAALVAHDADVNLIPTVNRPELLDACGPHTVASAGMNIWVADGDGPNAPDMGVLGLLEAWRAPIAAARATFAVGRDEANG